MEIIRNEKVAENTVELEFKVSAEEFEKHLQLLSEKQTKKSQFLVSEKVKHQETL